MTDRSPSEPASAPPAIARVAVFGATGFLGRRVVDAFADAGMEVIAAARHPKSVGGRESVLGISADVTAPDSLPLALRKVDAVVNCVGLYRERGGRTFASVHVEGARNLAEAARAAGVGRLVHISGIGADPASRSPYVRSRGAGEAAVRAAFPGATLIRPSMMFGPGGDALEAMAAILRASPVFPLFGSGDTRLQPVFVDDVAQAILAAATREDARGRTFELGGPEKLYYRDLVERVRRLARAHAALVPLPMAAWRSLAALSAMLPNPPVTEGQVALMARDNVADDEAEGLAALDVEATPLAAIAPAYLTRGR